MKKVIYILVVLFVVVFAITLPVYAHGHGYVRGGIWIGPGWWGPWWGGYPYGGYGAYPYGYSGYPYGYYSSPPVIIEQQSPAYEQQIPQQDEQPYYWYFCSESKAYYPYVKQCPGGWLKVVPSPQTPPRGKE